MTMKDMREIKGGEGVLLNFFFFSEPIVSELEKCLEIVLFLVLPRIILENSDSPSYPLSFILFLNFG